MEVRTAAIVKKELTAERIQVKRLPQRLKRARIPTMIVASVVQKLTRISAYTSYSIGANSFLT